MNKLWAFHKWWDSLKNPIRGILLIAFIGTIIFGSIQNVVSLYIAIILILLLGIWRIEYIIRRK
jgi:hypothetical protein